MSIPIERPGYETGAEEEIKEPSRYKVLMHNDDYTTMEFVVHILKTIFSKSEDEAVQIMLNIHRNGIGVCGTYTAEMAETKVALVSHRAKQEGYPLKCTMEEV